MSRQIIRNDSDVDLIDVSTPDGLVSLRAGEEKTVSENVAHKLTRTYKYVSAADAETAQVDRAEAEVRAELAKSEKEEAANDNTVSNDGTNQSQHPDKASDADAAVDHSAKPMNELLKEAKERGVDVKFGVKKAELVDLIEKDDRAKAEDAKDE